MSVSKLTKKGCILDVSCRFIRLPDELIVTILKKIRDPKTLICCSSVCKRLQCLVSEVDTISLRFSYPGEAGGYLPCWKSHYHVPQSAIPALMKVFANLISLEIRLCLCPSLLLSYYGLARKHAFKFQLKAVDMNDNMHTHVCMAFEVGLLSTDDEGILSPAYLLNIEKVKNPLMLSFFLAILCHRPKSLRSVEILSAGILGVRSKDRCRSEPKVGYRSGGNVFMESEQLDKLRCLIWNTRMNKSWLKNPQNLVCWLKKHDEDEHWLGEKLWLIHKWEGERCDMNRSIVKERDVEELLCAFDEEADEK
ncbi:unnamed protein product [Dovyalis caffra]|uniref:F-box domain-containing protein n=1 Tax=Dovyalis caffra TaxID=77055 RepID=A0AAV1RSL7_9ROSI|nr:unnamed protein product [Dovyalis caffra]